eukprot:TRINITY_DN12238_c0_g1_i4.p1 TRINITY_DN12238_c0_g1~~TRINITY_DN12238_c0_g1_i4.p1  ORF type:complete len:198 (-),score=15.19 TRINITY_DN12238_c0_g1_i4:175-768(-)
MSTPLKLQPITRQPYDTSIPLHRPLPLSLSLIPSTRNPALAYQVRSIRRTRRDHAETRRRRGPASIYLDLFVLMGFHICTILLNALIWFTYSKMLRKQSQIVLSGENLFPRAKRVWIFLDQTRSKRDPLPLHFQKLSLRSFSLFILTRTEVEDMFYRAGKIVDIFIPTDRHSGRKRGFVFVRFALQLEAKRAIEMAT